MTCESCGEPIGWDDYVQFDGSYMQWHVSCTKEGTTLYEHAVLVHDGLGEALLATEIGERAHHNMVVEDHDPSAWEEYLYV